MIHYRVWYWLEEINDAIIPGQGQLIGFDVKRDFFNPTDLIPVVGPLGKLYKASKLLKHGRKIKYYVWAGIGLATDVLIAKEVVEWYNERYRDMAEVELEEESPSPSQSGNADEEISGGGGTKTRLPPVWRGKEHVVRCRATKKSGKFRGQCVRRKGHSGAHFYK